MKRSINKSLARLSRERQREREKEDWSYQHLEWNRGYHYEPSRYQKNNKKILQTSLHT